MMPHISFSYVIQLSIKASVCLIYFIAAALPSIASEIPTDTISASNQEETYCDIYIDSISTDPFEFNPPCDEAANMYTFKPTQLILPGALLAAGVVGTYCLHDFKNTVRDHLSGYKKGHTFKADDYIQYTTAIGYVGLGFIPGIKTRSTFNQRLIAGINAYATMAILVNTMKYTIKHPRPGSGTRNSFPSGHSATVFTGAELMRIEYGNEVGLAAYAVALTVGYLRIFNDRHWITDVAGGAAIGILSARIGYWLMPLEQKLFSGRKNKKKDNNLALFPLVGYTNGLAFSMDF